ncbi:MAG: HDOD domain-containing protein [Myxococcales bacterium]|nr:HDOD domain-containing protein [Myxococcales bacterium]
MTTLWRKLTEQSAISTGNFAKLFGGMEISPLPQTAVKLIELVGQEDCDVREAATLISADLGISAKIMRTVNSAGMGLAVKVADVRGAVAMLGLAQIQFLTIAFAAADALPRKGGSFDGAAFWQTSLQRAVFAEALAAKIAPGHEGEAFTGGLLQDMAQPILLTQWQSHYAPVLERARDSDRSLISVEDDELSWNHAQAGAWLARSWGFPDVLVCCIGLHHSSLDELEGVGLDHSPVGAVAVASHLPDFKVVETMCLEHLDLSEEVVENLFQRAEEASEELAALFDVPKPSGKS